MRKIKYTSIALLMAAGLAGCSDQFLENKREYGTYDESLVYANVASRLGHDEEAVGILDTLVKLFPGKLEVRAMLANAYARNGQFREAIATYDTLETYSGKSLNLSLRKINFYMTLNDTAGIIGEGRRLFQTARSTRPRIRSLFPVMKKAGKGLSFPACLG